MRSLIEGEIYSSAFDPKLASYLTGASVDQLYRWRREGLIVPEFEDPRWPYSIRDLVVIRFAAFLRARLSLPEVRALVSLIDRDRLNADPDHYSIEHDGKTYRISDSFRPFVNFSSREVRDLEHPFPNIAIHPGRRGGWPCVTGTRINYETHAYGTTVEAIHSGEFRRWLPEVSKEAALESHALKEELAALGRK